ncbi:MAG: type IV pili methyl-accepting chemotaxis transducer N-terminal domain-containing protein [Candidatus Thiodiazotropha endolucinida]|nr:type IV pili methyl-accepting chemotaxis transducer N-terminal domain-containing protein [Candidatus Thiodiazotropha endolucinida]
MKNTRYLLTFCLTAFLCLSFSANAADIELAEAVNKAGKQRMLSQRIAKAYFFLGGNVRRDKAKQQLQKGKYLPSVVARTTESLLQDMNRVTGMYAKVTVM